MPDRITERRQLPLNRQTDNFCSILRTKVFIIIHALPLCRGLLAAEMRKSRLNIPNTFKIVVKRQIISHVKLLRRGKKTFNILSIHKKMSFPLLRLSVCS